MTSFIPMIPVILVGALLSLIVVIEAYSSSISSFYKKIKDKIKEAAPRIELTIILIFSFGFLIMAAIFIFASQ